MPLAALAALLIAGQPGAALAQDPGETFEQRDVETPKIKAGATDATRARRLRLSMGRSIAVELPRSAKEVFIANPAIANAVIRTARKMYVIAIAEGTTTIFVNDGNASRSPLSM